MLAEALRGQDSTRLSVEESDVGVQGGVVPELDGHRQTLFHDRRASLAEKHFQRERCGAIVRRSLVNITDRSAATSRDLTRKGVDRVYGVEKCGRNVNGVPCLLGIVAPVQARLEHTKSKAKQRFLSQESSAKDENMNNMYLQGSQSILLLVHVPVIQRKLHLREGEEDQIGEELPD